MPNKPTFNPEGVGGLLAQFGYLPEADLRKLKNLEYKQGLLQAADQRQYGNFANPGAAWLGGMVGAGLGAKMFKPALSAEERMKAEEFRQMGEELQYIDNWRQQAGLPPLSTEERDFALGDIAANRLAQAGDYNKASIIGMKTAQNRAMFKQKQLEQSRLIEQTEAERSKKRKTDLEIADMERERNRNPIQTVWLKGSNDPNSGFDAFINPDTGAAEIRDPKTGEVKQSFPAGTFTTNEPNRPPQPRGSGKSKDKDSQNRTPTEEAGTRNTVAAAGNTFRVQAKLADLLTELVDEQGQINIMGGAGATIEKVNRGANVINSLVRGLAGENINKSGIMEIKGFEGTVDGSAASIQRFAKNNRGRIKELIPVPDSMRADARAYQRYQALVIQLAYLRARSYDPTARQLSDSDFQVALQSTGGAASDPEAFRRILLEDMEGQYNNVLSEARKYPDDETFRQVAGPRAVDDFYEQYEKTKKRFSLSFGTSEAPGPGLTDYGPNGQRKANLPSPEQTEAARKAVEDTVKNIKPLK